MMSLLTRIGRRDTLAEFERAFPDRLRDARRLSDGGRSYWSVYTFGYVVEIVLKAAYCRLNGLLDGDDAWPLVSSARSRACFLNIARQARNLHDLVFWCELVIAERAYRGMAPLPTLSLRLADEVRTVAMNWQEYMRYHDAVDASGECECVSLSVSWIVQHYPALWR